MEYRDRYLVIWDCGMFTLQPEDEVRVLTLVKIAAY
jgi:hypothetical protein